MKEHETQCKTHRAQIDVHSKSSSEKLPYSVCYQHNRIRFWLNGKPKTDDIPPGMTTLDYLHQELGLFGTKCSCNEGDCGACTVVIAYASGDSIRYEAINSCLYPAAKLQGKHLITIESLGTPEKLHPIQEVLLDFHATQCGYCTPGFVMSLFALLVMCQNPSRERILSALEGNLCRCTGYDSILKAAVYLAINSEAGKILPTWCKEVEKDLLSFNLPPEIITKDKDKLYLNSAYLCPSSLPELFELIESHANKEFKLINGGTDIMVQINISRKKFPLLIDIAGIKELQNIREESGRQNPSLHESIERLTPQGDTGFIGIGAAVSYSEILRSNLIRQKLPALIYIIKRIASEQIRNFATLSGNIGNASPIADSIPLLLALGSNVKLMRKDISRVLPLQHFFLDYRKTALMHDEIIGEVQIPIPRPTAFIRSTKASKRKSVDIAALTTAVFIEKKAGAGGIIECARLALGGVAKVPILSTIFTAQIQGKKWQDIDKNKLADLIATEFEPISDVRGSKEYRIIIIKKQVQKYFHEADEFLRRQP